MSVVGMGQITCQKKLPNGVVEQIPSGEPFFYNTRYTKKRLAADSIYIKSMPTSSTEETTLDEGRQLVEAMSGGFNL